MGFLYERLDEPDREGHSFVFYGFDHVTAQTVLDAEAWCEERFGPNAERLDKGSRWWSNADDIYFRDEADAFQFRLRWC